MPNGFFTLKRKSPGHLIPFYCPGMGIFRFATLLFTHISSFGRKHEYRVPVVHLIFIFRKFQAEKEKKRERETEKEIEVE